MYARGYPVAFDASAEDRDNLALISIAVYLSDELCKPNCMLHSPTIPQTSAARRAAVLSRWYSLLLRVCDGAMTILSPVWMRMLRTFSMLQTVRLFPALSRMISYSICFHSPMYSSINNWRVMLIARPLWAISSSSYSL